MGMREACGLGKNRLTDPVCFGVVGVNSKLEVVMEVAEESLNSSGLRLRFQGVEFEV